MTDATAGKRYVLDRIEDGEWAVLDPDGDGARLHLPRSWLPGGAAEGDVIVAEAAGDGHVRFVVDAARTAERLARARERREGLPRGPRGDLSL